ncbi:MAG: hypothetical protein PHS41_11475 [Victivallaceae bacterium]|nr:hypothetical protein [Victivallaceae bacterium]
MWRLLFCAALLTFLPAAASADASRDLELFHFAGNGKFVSPRSDLNQIRMERNNSWLLLDGSASPSGNFQIVPMFRSILPEAKKIRLILEVNLPPRCRLWNLTLILKDKYNEAFVYEAPIPVEKEGRQLIYWDFPATGAVKSAGGGLQNNNKIDSPLRFGALRGKFVMPGAGAKIGFGRCSFQILDFSGALTAELTTKSQINVLDASQKERAVFRFRNASGETAKFPFEYTVFDPAGTKLTTEKYVIEVSPGKEKQLCLPAFSRYGIYSIDWKTATPGGKEVREEKNRRIAYFPCSTDTETLSGGFLPGIQAHTYWRYDEAQEEAAAAGLCGAKVIRTNWFWYEIERKKGERSFAVMDALFDCFAARNLELQLTAKGGAAWAADPEVKLRDPNYRKSAPSRRYPKLAAWSDFMRAFVTRYRGRFRFLEIWNEADLVSFANFSVEDYLKLLSVSAQILRSEAPEIKILTCGYAGIPLRSHPRHMIEVMKKGKPNFDVLAFHGHGTFESYVLMLNLLGQMLKEYPVPAWYANETAITSTLWGEAVQSDVLFQKYLHTMSLGAIGYTWYDLRNDGFHPEFSEHNYGLMTRDFQPKKAYVVYQMLNRIYRNAKFERNLPMPERMRCYRFRDKNGMLLLGHWNENPETPERLLLWRSLGADAFLIDKYGNEKKLHSRNGMLVRPSSMTPETLKTSGGDPVVAGELVTLQKELFLYGRKGTGEILLRNPTEQELKFDLSISYPARISADRASGGVVRVPPGKICPVPVAFSSENSGTPAAGEAQWLVLNGKVGDFWEGSLRFKISMVRMIPRDEFSKEPNFVLDSPKTLKEFSTLDSDLWKGPEDLSAACWFAGVDDKLRMKIVVRDDRHSQKEKGALVWKGDGIQVMVKVPGSVGCWEFGLSLLDSGKKERCLWHWPQGMSPEPSAMVLEDIVRDEKSKTTTYTASLQLSKLNLRRADLKSGIRVNLMVNDNDGTMRKTLMGFCTEKIEKSYPVIACP